MNHDVIVVGAGIAGLTAAKTLADEGLQVCVLEKSRGLGGRLATRRVATPQGEVPVDHGAQYFTCRSSEFQDFLTPLIERGTVTSWIEAVSTLTPQGIEPADLAHTYPRYCCPQGMNRLAKILATGLTVHRDRRVTGIHRENNSHWQVATEPGEVFAAPALILTPPPQQSLALLGSLAKDWDWLAKVRQVEFDPCLAVIAGYTPETDLRHLPDGLRWQNDPMISWSAVDSSKRDSSPMPVLVFHSTPGFAHCYEPQKAQEYIREILDHASQQFSSHLRLDLGQPEWTQAHLWCYAQPVNPLEQQWIGRATPAPLILGGCWCTAGRVEGAFCSGQSAAQALLEMIDFQRSSDRTTAQGG